MMEHDVFDVRDRIVIVTGGLGLLGREFSLALLERGAYVAVFDTAANEERIAARFGEHAVNSRVMFCSMDVTQRDSIAAGLEQVKARWGTAHALINNAALDSPPDAPAQENGPFETYPEASFDQVMNVNVKGVFLCSQVIGAEMARVGRGSIININSIYGLISPNQRIYEYRRRAGEEFFKPIA
jgi:NAD(P)-dependent dehydrogenase (short-subunit alcohol dehydrogenase family)